MPAENDVTKMKVADLKRELKLRGLATTGNKNELQDRLQTALIDGELSLEDTAISAEDDALLDEDAVLTDEDEAKILGADENELLKSPTTTPTAAPDLALQVKTDGGTAEDDVLTLSPSTPTAAAKKIVLKRKNSFTASNGGGPSVAAVPTTSKENTEPTTAKVPKMSERNPITALGANSKDESDKKEETAAAGAAKKVAQLSLQERLEMRAKKFGVTASATGSSVGSDKAAPASSVAAGGVTDEKQIEMLKKRAERFGCVVSSKIAKIDADEKLLKRKQRFGGAEGDSSGTTSRTTDVWAEKARMRLERFKTATSAAAAVVEADTAATSSDN